jgi:hypothetical protein
LLRCDGKERCAVGLKRVTAWYWKSRNRHSLPIFRCAALSSSFERSVHDVTGMLKLLSPASWFSRRITGWSLQRSVCVCVCVCVCSGEDYNNCGRCIFGI